MRLISALADCWLGLCRKTPALLHNALAVTPGNLGGFQSGRPDSGGAAGRQRRIRDGIDIAMGSISAIFSEKQLLWFPFLSGLVILILVLAERWSLSPIDPSYTASNLITIPLSDAYLIVFDLRLFLIEAVCVSGFIILLAALVHYRNARNAAIPITTGDAFSAVGRHACALTAFSVTMAFVATVLLEISARNEITSAIEFALSMAMFWLPYAYYFAPDSTFAALFFSFRIMVANIVLLLLALYVVPVIVIEGKGLLPAFAGSIGLMKKTWREMFGCAMVFFTIVLFVAAIALLIGQSPALLNNDYDFFLQESRGLVLMAGVCYGFLLACVMLIALGSAVLGIAITDLYACGKAG
jgi:hypothetical protein